MTLQERFENKYIPEPNSGCWIWLGYLNKYGYGRFWDTFRLAQAHRFSYELFKGPIPEGLEIDHLCRTRCCVNPDHLEVVTHRINLLRGNTVNRTHAEKTHCPHGHPYSGNNLLIDARGARVCRICKRHSQRRWEYRKRRSNESFGI